MAGHSAAREWFKGYGRRRLLNRFYLRLRVETGSREKIESGRAPREGVNAARYRPLTTKC